MDIFRRLYWCLDDHRGALAGFGLHLYATTKQSGSLLHADEPQFAAVRKVSQCFGQFKSPALILNDDPRFALVEFYGNLNP